MPCSTCGSSGSPTPYQHQAASPLLQMTGVGGFVIVEFGGDVPVQMVTNSTLYEFTGTRRRAYMASEHYDQLVQRFPSLRVVRPASTQVPELASPETEIQADPQGGGRSNV